MTRRRSQPAHLHPMRRCPCCGMDKGRGAFRARSKFCQQCQAPKRGHVGPTMRELEEQRADRERAAFNAYSAQVREEAGCPRRAG